MPEQNGGTCYDDALLAATAAGMVPKGTGWTKLTRIIHPRPELADLYDRRYALYRELYTVTRPLIDRLCPQQLVVARQAVAALPVSLTGAAVRASPALRRTPQNRVI